MISESDLTSGQRTATGRADAVRNDAVVVEAARQVFAELGADAPMSAIARRAGLGMGTLYRRYASKEHLLRQLCVTSMRTIAAEADNALTEEDPWAALAGFLRRTAAAGIWSMLHLAGSFTMTDEVLSASQAAREGVAAVVARAQQAGVLRPDITAPDICMFLERMYHASQVPEPASDRVGDRFLSLLLDGLRAPGGSTLPGSPHTWRDIETRWTAPDATS